MRKGISIDRDELATAVTMYLRSLGYHLSSDKMDKIITCGPAVMDGDSHIVVVPAESFMEPDDIVSMDEGDID